MSIYRQATPYVPDPVTFPIGVQLPFTRRSRAQFVAGVDVTISKLALATLTLEVGLPAFETQRSLFLAGASPSLYDGEIVHEAGFHEFPEGLVGTPVGGGSMESSCVYGGVLVFEWNDARGVRHQSAPSVPVSVTMGVGDTQIQWDASNLQLTDKELSHPVSLVLYRTVKNGTIYYRDVTVDNTITDTGFNTFSSTRADSDLISSELLYTTGGGLENEAFPSSTVSCLHQRRAFFATQEEQSFINYTDEMDERFAAPATNEVYRIPVPVEGGSVVGLASMDEKLIIFCQHRIYFIAGEGPNRLGQQNSYTLPQLCSASIGGMGGCHESIVLTPDGLWFLSSQNGLRLLTRGLQVAIEPGGEGDAYLGREADGLFDDVAGASAYKKILGRTVGVKSQVRWYLSGGEAGAAVVVWDHQQHKFTKFTNISSVGGAVAIRGVNYHSDGTSLFLDDTAPGARDNTTAIPQVLESAWIAMAGIQGFQRIYALMMLAEALDSASFKVEIGYDYEDAYASGNAVGSLTVNAAQALRMRVAFITGQMVGTLTGLVSGATATIISDPLSPGGDVIVSNVVGSFVFGETVSATNGESGTFAEPPTTPAVRYSNTSLSSPLASGDTLTGDNSAASGIVSSLVADVSNTWILFNGAGFTGTFSNGEVARFTRPWVYAVTAANPLQIEHAMIRQKCEALRFRLTITPTNATEAVRLTGFALSVGVKQGLNRLPAAQRF